jgi:hypothetical protein
MLKDPVLREKHLQQAVELPHPICLKSTGNCLGETFVSILVRYRKKIPQIRAIDAVSIKPKPDASALKTWIDAANEGSTLLQILYTAFLVYLAVVFALVLSTTHKQLFWDSPINVSFGQSLTIKTSLFYIFFPLVLLYLHFQLLWQMDFVSRKLTRVAVEVGSERLLEPDIRLRLGNLVLTHALVDNSYLSRLARLVLTITLAIAPPILLLYAQIVFLPYHSEAITWTHRLTLLADVLLLAAIWSRIFSPNSMHTQRKQLHTFVGLLLTWIFSLFASFAVILFPEERLHDLYGNLLPDAVMFDPKKFFQSRSLVGSDCVSLRDGDLPAINIPDTEVVEQSIKQFPSAANTNAVRCDYPHRVSVLSARFFGSLFPHSLQQRWLR